MSDRLIRLYGIPLSHPVLAVREMLDRRELSYRYVELLAGRRVQGSLAVARALQEIVPDPCAARSGRAAVQWLPGQAETPEDRRPTRLACGTAH